MKRLAIIVLLLLPASLFGQKSLEGKVIDSETGMGMPGANIYWAGTTTGTSTNSAGYFVLKRVRKADQLVISYVGYASDTILIQEGTDYYEHLLDPVTSIGDIVIYGRAEGTHIDRIDPLLTYKITGAELTKAACCNLSESFTTNASVDVTYSDAVTGAKQIQLLGLAGTYVQMMTENFPALYGLGSAYGLGYIPGPWMESIQVSKGTGTVRNGYEAITGQINVEFKKPESDEMFHFNSYLNSSGKSEGNLNGSVRFSDRLSSALLVHGEYDNSASDHNHDGFRDEPNIRQYHLFNRWNYNTETVHLGTGIRFMDEQRISGQVAFSPDDSGAGPYGVVINTTRAEAFTKTGLIFRPDRSMSIGWINNVTMHDQDALYGSTVYTGSQRSYYSNLLYQWKPLLSVHTIDAGVSYKYDRFEENLNSVDIPRAEKVPGVFLQYSYVDTAKVVVVAGIRADFHNLYGTFYTPRINVRYELTDNSTLRLSAGKGYRSTNVLAENQYLLASSRDVIIDDDLELENAWNAGVSLTSYFTPGNTDLRITADYYHTRFINQVVVDLDRDPGSVWFYNLEGKSFSNVLQVEAQWSPVSRLDLLLAARINDARTTTGGELRQRALTSRYKGLFTASYLSNLRRWQYDMTVSLNGPGRVPSTAANPVEYQVPETFDAYTLLNGQVTRKFKHFDLYLGVENLLDFRQEHPVISADNPFSDYFDASLVWGPVQGRMIYAGMRLTLNRNS